MRRNGSYALYIDSQNWSKIRKGVDVFTISAARLPICCYIYVTEHEKLLRRPDNKQKISHQSSVMFCKRGHVSWVI